MDPGGATAQGDLFRRNRDRAVLYMLRDTTARREELTNLTRLTLKRRGKRCGIDHLHPHRIRHNCSVAPEQVVQQQYPRKL